MAGMASAVHKHVRRRKENKSTLEIFNKSICLLYEDLILGIRASLIADLGSFSGSKLSQIWQQLSRVQLGFGCLFPARALILIPVSSWLDIRKSPAKTGEWAS